MEAGLEVFIGHMVSLRSGASKQNERPEQPKSTQ
jgi:hypothetical protein